MFFITRIFEPIRRQNWAAITNQSPVKCQLWEANVDKWGSRLKWCWPIKQKQQASKSNILERHKASVGWMRGIWGNWSPAIYFIAPLAPSNLNPQAQKLRGRAGSSKCNPHFSSSAKSDIFATKYKVVYNISDELNFWEEPGFDPSSSNWVGEASGWKENLSKVGFFGSKSSVIWTFSGKQKPFHSQ